MTLKERVVRVAADNPEMQITELAERFGKSVSAIGKWIGGRPKQPYIYRRADKRRARK